MRAEEQALVCPEWVAVLVQPFLMKNGCKLRQVKPLLMVLAEDKLVGWVTPKLCIKHSWQDKVLPAVEQPTLNLYRVI